MVSSERSGRSQWLAPGTAVVPLHSKAVQHVAAPLADLDTALQLDQQAAVPGSGGSAPHLVPLAKLSSQPLPDLTHLMASQLGRTYTDDDWFAALRGLERVRVIHQAQALSRLRAAHAARPAGPHGHGPDAAAAGADAASDAWFDCRSHTMSSACVSDEERAEVDRLAQELEESDHASHALNVVVVREPSFTASCVPDPPLIFGEKHWRFCQVGDLRPFSAYWERDNVLSSRHPLPIDLHMKLNSLFVKVHESIPGMWLRDEGDKLLLTATPQMVGVPGLVNYTEYFNKDSSLTTWGLRRDLHMGRTQGQMFMTTDGILIFRVFTIGIWSKKVEWVGEDYSRLEEDGSVIITRQAAWMPDGSTESQFLVGRKKGLKPPSGYHK